MGHGEHVARAGAKVTAWGALALALPALLSSCAEPARAEKHAELAIATLEAQARALPSSQGVAAAPTVSSELALLEPAVLASLFQPPPRGYRAAAIKRGTRTVEEAPVSYASQQFRGAKGRSIRLSVQDFIERAARKGFRSPVKRAHADLPKEAKGLKSLVVAGQPALWWRPRRPRRTAHLRVWVSERFQLELKLRRVGLNEATAFVTETIALEKLLKLRP